MTIVIKVGDRVAVEYEGRFEDGSVFDSSTHEGHSHPLIFTVGKHEVIPGFEQCVVGLKQGDSKEITIAPKDAYGEHDARLMRSIPKGELKLPRNQEPTAGMSLMTYTPEGQPIQIFVREVTKDTAVLDLNHPLAGKMLVFTLTIIGINETIKPEHEHRHEYLTE